MLRQGRVHRCRTTPSSDSDGSASWWRAVAGAGAGAGGAYRLSPHRLGLRPNRLVTLATVAPFLLFAFGIAIGSEWTAWH